jgi:hypothetical protein
MKDGVNVEEGTHEELVNRGEVYYGMVGAQQLEPLESLNKERERDDVILPKEEVEPQEYHVREVEEKEELQARPESKNFGFFRSFYLIVREHRAHWLFYIFIIVGAIGAGCKYCVSSLNPPN